MPAKLDLSWESKSRRWWKQFGGKRYVVSCRQLVKLGHLPASAAETKEASYRAANAWWDAKLVELRGQPQPTPEPLHPHQDIIDQLNRRIGWAKEKGLDRLQDNAEFVKHMIESSQEISREDLTPFIEANGGGTLESWGEVVGQSPPTERTIKALSERFLALSMARVQDGELSPSEHDLACRCVGHFVEWLGGVNEPNVITPEKWEAYWHHLRKLIADKKRSREYAKKDWRYGRAFVEWLASMDKMPLPKNLHDRRYKIGETNKAVITFTDDEIKKMIAQAKGQLKLHLLLMLNCGFYQGDISDLRRDEVDLENGYIIRQRSKTRRHHGDKVPTVRYKLWPVTLDLLRTHVAENQHETLALTNRNGLPWLETKVVNGRAGARRDGIKSNFAHLADDLKIEKPLKCLRKSSATKLDSEAEYARFAQYFLGHSGKTTAEEYYLNRDGKPFDEAVEWLGRQYGLC